VRGKRKRDLEHESNLILLKDASVELLEVPLTHSQELITLLLESNLFSVLKVKGSAC
jgi:hypothetical protein